MNSKRVTLVTAAAVLTVCAAGLGYVWFWSQTEANTLLLSGNIEAHESVLSFKSVQSRIVELPFDEGQWVRAGTVLARVGDHDYQQQVRLDEAQLEMQQRQLASARHNRAAARASVASDRADTAEKTLDYRRYQTLWMNEATSAQSRDLAATALKQSRANYKRDLALEAAAERNVAVAAANVKSARAALKLAKIILGYTVLQAPFSGVLMVRNAELGEVVQPGTPVFTLADLDHVWMRGYVNETDVGRVRLGGEAKVTTDSYPNHAYRGRISFIAPDAEFTPKSVETHSERVTLVYRIRIDIYNPTHELKPGMPADATLRLEPAGAS